MLLNNFFLTPIKILLPPNEGSSGLYRRGWRLDQVGHDQMAALARQIGECSDCDGTGSLVKGMFASVRGTVQALSNGDVPPILKVDAVSDESVQEFCSGLGQLHNVYKQQSNTCDVDGRIEVGLESGATYTITPEDAEAGSIYFASHAFDECNAGLLLKVDVVPNEVAPLDCDCRLCPEGMPFAMAYACSQPISGPCYNFTCTGLCNEPVDFQVPNAGPEDILPDECIQDSSDIPDNIFGPSSNRCVDAITAYDGESVNGTNLDATFDFVSPGTCGPRSDASAVW